MRPKEKHKKQTQNYCTHHWLIAIEKKNKHFELNTRKQKRLEEFLTNSNWEMYQLRNNFHNNFCHENSVEKTREAKS